MDVQTPSALKPAAPFLFDRVEPVSSNSLLRQVTVKPSMCGQNSLLVGRIGDWTWEAVSYSCGINAFRARDESDAPVYLSFYYYHLMGDLDFHLYRPTFGDVLQAVSTCYAFGSESVLTLHRLAFLDGACPSAPVTLEEFYHSARRGCLYAMNVNRWIKRGAQGNSLFSSSVPRDFRVTHLPPVPASLSPRAIYDTARRRGHFGVPDGCHPLADHDFEYLVDISRDFNGVGLLYFSSFFSMIDKAVASIWARLGRTNASFFQRRVTAERVLYLGNADPDASLLLHVVHRLGRSPLALEHLDIQILENGTRRVLAIADVVIRE